VGGGFDTETAELADAILALDGREARRAELSRLGPRQTPALARALCARAHEVMRSDPAGAAQRAELALEVADGVASSEAALDSASAVAQASVVVGRYEDALATAEEASRRAVAAGVVPARLREVALVRVEALAHLERYDEARAAGASLVASCDAEGDLRGRIWSRMVLADVAFRTDEPREALRLYREVDALLPSNARASLRAALEVNRANALEATNRFRAASRRFESARSLFESVGEGHGAAQADYNAAYAEAMRGLYGRALVRYARVEGEFRRLSDERHLAHVDLDRAEIHLHMHLGKDARALATSARERFDALGLGKESATATLLAGRGARLAGDLAAAGWSSTPPPTASPRWA
jgi:tetratricopeptide (TPR) repeat protein